VTDPRIAAALAAEASGDLDAAVRCWDAVVAVLSEAVPADSCAQLLDAAARARLSRARAGGPRTDLDVAADLWRLAVALLAPDAGTRGMILNNRAVALFERWERDRSPERLGDAVEAARDLAVASASGTADGAQAHLLLGTVLRERFRLRGAREDLDDAVAALQQAETVMAGAAQLHEELGNALHDRVAIGGWPDDLAQAITHLTRAVEALPGDDPDAPAYWSNLAAALLDRYERASDRGDLDAAIAHLERACAMSGSPSDELLSNLGTALRMRAVADASLEDLDRALPLLRRAAAVDDDKLGNLGAGLLERFGMTGRVEDVDEAIRALRTAVEGTSRTDAALPSRLNNLGIALRERHLRRGTDREDVDAAIATFERALVLTHDGDPGVAALRANLGGALRQRHDALQDPEDLDRAVCELDRASRATPDRSTDSPIYLNNLGAALFARSRAAAHASDRERALAVTREAVRRCPPGSVLRGTCLVNLANVLSGGGDVAGARDAYREAIAFGLVANPAGALAAAHNWSAWACERGAWDEAVEAVADGEQATRQLLRAQLLRADKETWLRDAQGLAANGAYAHVALGRAQDAVAMLERERAQLVWDVLERAQVDLRSLEQRDPELARRYRVLADSTIPGVRMSALMWWADA
jgi:tetratricopeptide (TPR) repeat protein